MTKEQYHSLPHEEQSRINDRWKHWWKKTQPKSGFTHQQLEEAQLKFIRAQPKP